MHSSVHIRSRSVKKFQSTCLSIEHPLAFSIQLKPSSQSQNISPKSLPHHPKQKKNTAPEETKKRVMSAQVNSSVRALSGKSYTNWGLSNADPSQKQNIKWIGVHPNPKNSELCYSQAFPRRQHKNADQSFANFMLRYGRSFKHAIEGENVLRSSQDRPDKSLIMNAATVKVKPRLTWFGKKKSSSNCSHQKSRFISRSELEVVWWKTNN